MAESPKTALAKREPTHSERFAAMVERQFAGEVGNLNFTSYEKTLAQHLFIKVDAALAEAETKRRDASKPAIAWPNINMTKLAIDAVNRVQLGIDALIPGSLYDDDVPGELYECFDYEYPSGAVVVARLLKECVAPALRFITDGAIAQEGNAE